MKRKSILFFAILSNFFSFSQTENIAEKQAILAQADAYYKTENLKSAFDKYLIAKTLYEKKGVTDDEKYYYIINQIGLIHYKNTNYSDAISVFEKAINLQNVESSRKTKIFGSLLNNLAAAHAEIGNYQKAKKYYIESLDYNIAKKTPNTFEHVIFLNNLADLYVTTGEYSEAEPLYKTCLEKLEEINERSSNTYSKVVNNLGELYLNIGFYDLAIIYLNKSLELKKRLEQKDVSSEVNTMINLASASFYSNNLEESEKIFLAALKKKAEISSIESAEYANMLANYAELVAKKGLNKKYFSLLEFCQKSFEKNLENFQKNRDYIINKINLAYATYLNNDIENAKTHFLALNTFFTEYKLFESFEYSYFLARYIEFASNIDEIDLISDEMLIKSYTSKKAELLNNFPKLTEKERLKYYDKNENYFNNIKRFCVHRSGLLGKVNPKSTTTFTGMLLDFEINQKGFVLNSLNSTKQQLSQIKDTSNLKIYQTIEDEKVKLTKLYQKGAFDEKSKRELNELVFKINTLEKKLFTRLTLSSEYENKILGWKRIQTSLLETEAMVDVFRVRITKDSAIYYALILQKSFANPKLIEIAKSTDLEKRYIKYYRNSIKSQQDDLESFNVFWNPIEKHLGENIKSVYFSNDGVYNQVNISTLKNPKTNKYVIEKYRIDYVTNPGDVAKSDINNKKQTDEINSFYLFGRPSYNLEGNAGGTDTERDATRAAAAASNIPFSDLPETEVEIKQISQLLQNSGKKIDIYIKEKATEENFYKVSGKSIVHLATHGYFVPSKNSDVTSKEPLLRSGLVLADVNLSKRYDGLLSAYELNQKNLENIELIVLSACETGLGEIKNGEGVFGLQRAILSAGAKSIIMSLWTVNDNSTKELMIEFYKNYLQTKNKREALHLAQLKTLKKFNHPYFWGAFIYLGN